jgi:hypothetical protein
MSDINWNMNLKNFKKINIKNINKKAKLKKKIKCRSLTMRIYNYYMCYNRY